ncbi:MAG TPA: NAD-dependent epimerase/dehydratase family protein [Solirubrobacterales bacterium]|nr:NAD-dependent epimerase/dehydratase family protein [Solirubrobacterales bacterium]
MRVFLAGASGAIGRQLVPQLVAAGHEVAGTTRSEEKAGKLRGLGAEPVVLDVYDAEALREAVVAFAPELVMHQLTDLPPDPAEIPAKAADNARVRSEGTRNLIAAAQAAAAPRFHAQSIAWRLPGDAHASVEEHEAMVLDAGGVVLRYGRFYGPGTYNPEAGDLPEPPRIHVAEAARRTVELLEAPSGIVEIADS